MQKYQNKNFIITMMKMEILKTQKHNKNLNTLIKINMIKLQELLLTILNNY